MGERKKRILISASPQSIKRAERALLRMGYGTKSNYAEVSYVSASSISKFFSGKLLQLDTFQRICEELEIPRQEITDDLSDQEELINTTSNQENLIINSQESSLSKEAYKVTLLSKENNEKKLEIILYGDIESIDNTALLLAAIKRIGGGSIRIVKIEPGSIKISLSGSPEDIKRLSYKIISGEINEISGYEVQDLNGYESLTKWDLVELIRELTIQASTKRRNSRKLRLAKVDLSDTNLSQVDLSFANLNLANLRSANLSRADLKNARLIGVKLSEVNLSKANLSEANLSRADLKNARLIEVNLSEANLSEANLSRADLKNARLIGVNLSKANLRGANLTGTDLIEADLRSANLRSANLSQAILTNANVDQALFVRTRGITSEQKEDLIGRGAIFSDNDNISDRQKSRV